MLNNEKFVRRLALFLCLSLIIGIIPASIWNVPFAVSAAPEGTVVFSDDVEAYNFKSKWSLTGTTMRWPPSPGYEYQGDYVMIIQGVNDTATSPAFAVTPGKAYNLNYWTKQLTSGTNSSVQIRFYNASGVLIASSNPEVACGSAEWMEKNVSAVAPDGAATAKLYFSTKGEQYAVDVMTVTEGDADPDATVATEPTEATQPVGNPVLNAGFEDGTENWTAYLPTEVVTGDAHSGNASMQLTDDTKSTGGYITQYVSVEPGKTYELSVWVKVLSGKDGYFGIYDIGDAAVAGGLGSSSAWTKCTVSVTIPAGFTSAKIEIGSSKSGIITCLVDDVTFTEMGVETPEETQPTTEATEPTAATVPDSTPIFEDAFEKFTEPSKNIRIPNGWTASEYTAAIGCAKYDKDYDGSWNLCVQDLPAKWIRTPAIEAVPGYIYTVVFAEKKYQPTVAGKGGYGQIVFTDANGNALKEATVTVGTAETWTERAYEIQAPAGAVSFYIEFGIKNASGEPTYSVDDLKVYATAGELDPDATESTEPTQAPTVGGMTNNGFENGMDGWNENAIASVYTGDKHSGNSCVMITDTTRDSGGYISRDIPVEPGKTYTLSVWVKVLSATVSREGYFGIYGIGDAAVACMTGSNPAWTQYSVTVTIPEGYTSVTIEIGAHKGSVTTYLIDDVTFEEGSGSSQETKPTEDTTPTETQPTETTEPTEPPVFKDAFEQYFTPDGANYLVRIPKDWTISEQTAAIGCAKYDKNYDGSWNLCIQDAADKWVRSPLVEAVPGYEYNVVFHEKKYQPGQPGDGGYVKVVFVDADGKALKEYEIEAGTSKNWTEKTLYSKAPEGAKAFYVEFGLSGPTGEPTYSVDDLAVYAFEAALDAPDVTQPTEPPVVFDPMKPLEEKFEDQLHVDSMDAGPAGWYSNDDNSGVFAPMIGLVNDELSYDGNYLILKKAGQWCIQSPEFPVEIGYAYTATFVARKLMDNEDFYGTVEICFINSRGKVIEIKSMPAGKTYGAWTEESVTAVAPLGALKAYVQFKLEYNDRRMDGDYAVDDLVVTRSEEQSFAYTPDPDSTEPSEYKTIYTDTFQSYYKPDPNKSVNSPTGWTPSEQSAAIGTATYDSYDGSRNLCIQDRGDKWIKGPMINAKPGNIYYATFMEKKLQPHQDGTGAYVKLCFVDENGKVIKEYKADIGTSKTWTEKEVGGQAPEGTVQLYVEFGIASATGQPSYSVDNLEVIEGVPRKPGQQPSDPEPSEPENEQPGAPDDNAPTGDDTFHVSVPVVLMAALTLAVLVLKKRRYF